MADYRAVMDQVLKGWSVRQICSSSRCSHTTVQKARDALVEHDITTREQLFRRSKWKRCGEFVVALEWGSGSGPCSGALCVTG